MARTPNQTEVTQHIATDADTQGLPTMADAWNEIAIMEHEVNQNAVAVARQVNYDGTLTVGALEDEIRFYQRRSVEACIELGKRLMVLKELTPHGEFEQRVELLGFAARTARRFMQAAFKVSKSANLAVLSGQVTNTSKFLELLILDDGEIEALESGETVRGVTLDKIETMSYSELKKALRDANERIEAKDKVIQDKSAFIDSQSEKLAGLENKVRVESLKPISPEQRLLDLRSNLQITAADIKVNVMTRLRQTVKALADYAEESGASETAFMTSSLIEISRELSILQAEYYLPNSIDASPVDPIWAAMAAGQEIVVPGAAEFAARMAQQDSE